MRTFISLLVPAIILIAAALGCSGGQPVSPDSMQSDIPEQTSLLALADAGGSAPGVIGIYEVNIDSNLMTSEIVPIRATSSVDVLESVDVTGYLTSTPCSDCVRISSIGLNEADQLVVGIGIKHPFPQGNPLELITPKNRADIHVFNVEGIILTDYPEVVNYSSSYIDMASGYLANADGYTAYLDSMIDNVYSTASKAHPYILHFDDYSNGNFSASNPNGFADYLNPTGNLVMKMGSDYSIKNYIFDVPQGESLSFGFAVGCTYGMASEIYSDRFNPVYRMPQYNKKAASEIHVEVVNNNLERGDLTSTATLRIEVMDINSGVAVGDAIDQIAHSSNVLSIIVDAPNISDKVTVNNPTPISGDGRNLPLVYEVTITNSRNGQIGMNPCLVKIKDSYPVWQNPNPAFSGADALGRLTPSTLVLTYLSEMSTLQFTEIEVNPCTPLGLRPGLTPVDIGADSNGNVLIGYNDSQVHKYDADYCSSKHLYTFSFNFSGSLLRLDVQEDGRSVAIGDGCTG